MRGLLLEVCREVDDLDGVEGALLDADAAADAQVLADGRDLVQGSHLIKNGLINYINKNHY